MPTTTHQLADPNDWDEAIAAVGGPQLVLAGPGTGKSQFLARRAAYLIERGTPAPALVVLTFSRRAAAELERRIDGLLARPASGATATTFHSFAHRLVEADRASRGGAMPILMTGPEQVRLVGELLAAEDETRWPATFRPLLRTTTFASEVADFVMRCQERLLTGEQLAALANERSDWRALPHFLGSYREALERTGRVDYGTLLLEAVSIVSRGRHIDQFQYVLVDEYQDTSPVQTRLAESVPGESGNITVAADPHQSIYSFRGADLDNVEGFSGRITGQTGREATVFLLSQSLRVPGPILESAQRIVAANPVGNLPRLDVAPAPHPGAVEAYTFDQRSAEAEWIAGEVERLHRAEDLPLRHMAVVVRSTRHLLPELSRALDRHRIPHDRPDTRLVDHPAVRMINDVVTAAIAPGDDERLRAVRRLLLGPLLHLPLSRERDLVRRQRRLGIDWPETVRRYLPDSTPLADLLSDSTWATDVPAVQGFWHLWDHLPHLGALITDPGRRDYRAAWTSLARMLDRQSQRDPDVTLAAWFETMLTGDFEESPLLSFSRPDHDRLVVTTLHQAKGLEFEVVFVADAVEGVFPDTRRNRGLLQSQLLSPRLTTDGVAQAAFRLAEERRLAYTATTRARRRVVWTATTAGIDEGERRPSRFILAAVARDSFEGIGPPPPLSEDGFAPLTLSEAEARLRRFLADPSAPTVDRIAALGALVSDAAPWEPSFFAGVPERGPDTGVVGPGLRLSPSQAMLYDECPRRYVLERRLRAVDSESPYLAFGSIIHEVLELAERDALGRGRPHADLDRAIIHLDAIWGSQADFGTPEMNGAWYRRAVSLLAEIYGNWPGGDAAPIALELDMSASLGGVEWVGRADRVDRSGAGVKVVDYKTSKSPPTLKEAGSSLQLGFYLLAAAGHPRLREVGPPVAAELWYPLARGSRKTFPFDMEELDAVRESLAEVARDILAEDWTPRVGRHCDRCSFRRVCPAWPDGRSL